MGTANKPPVTTQAAREAAKAIRRAKKLSDKTSVQQSGSVLRNLLLSEAQGEAEGKDALSNLKRLRASKLPKSDTVIMAQRLYGEVQRLKQHLRTRGMLLRDFCSAIDIDASGSSKELHRLTLAPNQDPAMVRLRRSADKYYTLIQGISKHGNRNLNTLADDVLRGTSLHPAAHLGEMNEAEKLETALQLTVDKIDREFNLYEKYMKTATLRREYILAGSREYWPLLGWFENDDEEERYLEVASNPRYTFWDNPSFYTGSLYTEEMAHNANIALENEHAPIISDTGVIQSSELFYIPHAYFGPLEIFNIKIRRPENPLELIKYNQHVKEALSWWRQKVESHGGMSLIDEQKFISDDWDDEDQAPINQLPYSQRKNQRRDSLGAGFAWLILYPTKDNAKLMLMLYIGLEEGGSYILPLNARNLEILRGAYWVGETEAKSAFDHIKDMLGYRVEQEKTLEQQLRRTAPWFDHNPIFKIAKKKAEDIASLDEFCSSFWKNN